MTPAEIMGAAGEALPAGTRCTADGGTVTVDVDRSAWLTALRFARDALGCDFFDFLTAVDEGAAGFAIVVHLYSIEGGQHLLIRTLVPRQAPAVASATGLFRGAEWAERETREMFGVVFEGHPDPAPLLLPDGFEGHPLRKDFTLAARAAKQWPGGKEPGESAPSARSRRRLSPPGVPEGWRA